MKNIMTMTMTLLLWAVSSPAANFTVDSTADGNPCNQTACTLRGAILAALATPEADTISFDIPADPINENYFSGGSGASAFQYWMIQPTSELPSLIDITIDGSTAGTSTAGNPTIVIDGSLAGDQNAGPYDTLDGLTLLENSHIKALSVTNWYNAGVRMGYFTGSYEDHGFNNKIISSWIGLNMPYGQASAPNKFGIIVTTNEGENNVIGGYMPTEGNVISGNLVNGIQFDYYLSEGSVGVFGNKIGTNPEGDLAVPNDTTGIFLSSRIHSNVMIGANLPGLGNLISGNNINGIHISPDQELNLKITNNLIGTDLSGMVALPNREGIVLSRGRDVVVEKNIISGNSGTGLLLSTSSNSPLRRVDIISNFIGVAEDGVTPLPNHSAGIRASGIAIDTKVGKPGEGNTIAYNQCGPTSGCGVLISNFSNNVIELRYNSIHNNENEGIDLESDGFTPNDPGDFDSGANRLQNFPDINSAQHDPSGNRINLNYQIDSHNGASDYPITVDVYAADSDGEEGQTWLASTTFTESQWLAGNPVARTLSAAAPISEGDVIVTTATEGGGRTSEFSPGFTLAGQPDFSITCRNTKITTTSVLSCTLNCEAEAVNGWGDEVGLSCDNPDSSCGFSPSDEIGFTQAVVPFTVAINHSAMVPGIYLNEVVGGADLQVPIERQEVITINQLAVDDYIFNDGFDGIICQ
ncbi:right-handed parallel beta-helix repeat-containing protein [Marinicella rhabdoformis]|uniref:right-handed parallel beta-helix repeat-containing protein n=1 Tax=Marinicella rhabdoformis TaxID=2580566 RepID=UPI0012AEB643|nr:right-handed parallel beta-helix repeat-containing protein [Marinicella rhabdoformis]